MVANPEVIFRLTDMVNTALNAPVRESVPPLRYAKIAQ
jgi:hypothetical protein